MFGLEKAFKKVTDLFPGKEGGAKGDAAKVATDDGVKDKAKTKGEDRNQDKDKDKVKDKDKDKDKDKTMKDGKKEEIKTRKPDSTPPAETYEDYLIACVCLAPNLHLHLTQG